MSSIIYDTFANKRTSDRDQLVAIKINDYITKHVNELSDGILRFVPKIAGDARDSMARPYEIDGNAWSQIMKSPEFSKMANSANVLKFGLIISYIDTNSKIFLIYLGILIYSQLYHTTYFKKGINENVIKYTLEQLDDRSDFKKYDMSLIVVLNKKIDAYINNYKHKFKKGLTDRVFRELYQGFVARINDTLKVISQKYYNNIKDPDVNIIIRYAQTSDGKAIISPVSIFEDIRAKSIDKVAYPSMKVFDAIGLGIKNIPKIKYRVAIMEGFPHAISYLSKVTILIIDYWIKRYQNNLDIKTFRTKFLSVMSVARGLKEIYDSCDSVVEILISEYQKNHPTENFKFNKVEMRKYIYQYLIFNIYMTSTEVFNG